MKFIKSEELFSPHRQDEKIDLRFRLVAQLSHLGSEGRAVWGRFRLCNARVL